MARKNFDITPEQVKDFQEATLMDDDFMEAFFRNNIPAVQLVLSIIMDKPGLVVSGATVQHTLEDLGNFHGVRFDVYASDAEGRQYDIEFQNRPDGADPHRADFNCAMMTVRTLNRSENYNVLAKRERVVIFITKTDVLKDDKPLYTIERVIRETSKPFNDGTKIIYVNTSHENTSTELGKLIHDFRCKNPDEWYHTDISKRAKLLKGDEETVKEIEALKERVRADATETTAEHIALSLIKDGTLSLAKIAKICSVDLSRVNELALMVNY